jgi:hypothetical protein
VRCSLRSKEVWRGGDRDRGEGGLVSHRAAAAQGKKIAFSRANLRTFRSSPLRACAQRGEAPFDGKRGGKPGASSLPRRTAYFVYGLARASYWLMSLIRRGKKQGGELLDLKRSPFGRKETRRSP